MNLGSPFCVFCEDEIETELHVLRDCSNSMVVWLNTVQDSDQDAFFSADFQQWLDMNLQGNVKGADLNDWPSYWAIACHALWTWRNKEEHDDTFTRPYRPHLNIKKIKTDYETATRVNYNVVLVP
ncbi:ribonuclease H, partial [Trifolium medium]|nr:ribonuclease H [Trifolium medium]